jgi:prefoldin subunit 4
LYDAWFFRYKVGEAFLHIPHPAAMKRLERDQQDLDSQLDAQRALADGCDKEMKELKVLLYGKFGRSINLDE